MDAAKQVIAHYPLKIKKVSLLSDKGKKAVWSIQTDTGRVILKKIPIDKEYLAFMIHVIGSLKKKGVLTPGVIRTETGEDHVVFQGDIYVAFEAVNGQKPTYKNETQLVKIMQAMAHFHKASTDIPIPPGINPSCLLGSWKAEFLRRCDELEKWKADRINAKTINEFDRLFLLHVDFFLKQGRRAISILDQSCYQQWVEQTKAKKTLCHQDFAAGNLALDDNGNIHVFDMDTLTIDLPVRDMRKILNKVMRKQKKWDFASMMKMMKAYQEVNPLTKEQYTVLTADVFFPHLFFGQVSKYYGTRQREWTEEKHVRRLADVIETEGNKEAVLLDFQARIRDVVSPLK
ncbi:CotS family spore coat protein [Brevibacillus sp. NRS-1366]|uniref:CotS family spore coat protein n=1 Tax=Brevibacillus sp. NRS-1366 TaxID=3233899 RepID=UPI003D1E248A